MRKRYTHEEDQILINMVFNGSTNEQIAQAIHRTVRSVESRKAILKKSGADMPRSPGQMSIRVDEPQVVESTDDDSHEVDFYEEQIGEIDALELLRVEIDNLNRNEADLLDQLDCVRAEKLCISVKLNKLLESLSNPTPLELEDPA